MVKVEFDIMLYVGAGATENVDQCVGGAVCLGVKRHLSSEIIQCN